VSGSEATPETPASFWRRLYAGWMTIVARFGFVQTLVVLALFYAFLIGPMALGASVARRDWLGKRGVGAAGTAWGEADTAAPDFERSKQPY